MRKVLSVIIWTAVSLTGAGAFAALALHRGEHINSIYILTAALLFEFAAFILRLGGELAGMARAFRENHPGAVPGGEGADGFEGAGGAPRTKIDDEADFQRGRTLTSHSSATIFESLRNHPPGVLRMSPR